MTRSLMICTAHQILFGLSNQEGIGRACSTYGDRRDANKGIECNRTEYGAGQNILA